MKDPDWTKTPLSVGSDDLVVPLPFTSGPWRAEGYEVYQRVTGTRHIAYTGPHHTPPDEYPKSCRRVDEANARLIAAAPMMFSALQQIANNPGDCDMETGFTSGHLARAAIREALGHNTESIHPESKPKDHE